MASSSPSSSSTGGGGGGGGGCGGRQRSAGCIDKSTVGRLKMVGAVGEAGSCQGEPVSAAYWLNSSNVGIKSSKGFRMGES